MRKIISQKFSELNNYVQEIISSNIFEIVDVFFWKNDFEKHKEQNKKINFFEIRFHE